MMWELRCSGKSQTSASVPSQTTNTHACQSTQDAQKLFRTQKWANTFSSSSVHTLTYRGPTFLNSPDTKLSYNQQDFFLFIFYLITGVRLDTHTLAHTSSHTYADAVERENWGR